MTVYLPQPMLVPHPANNQLELAHPYMYTCDEHLNNSAERPDDYSPLETFSIPKGFMFDGASIPSMAQGLTFTPFHPDVLLPALVHDWLYTVKETSRELADYLFMEALLWNGVPRMKAAAMHWAVREFGSGVWADEADQAAHDAYLNPHLASEGNDR